MSDTLTATDGQIKTYRGASIEELLPQIRAELGPEAVVLSRREGLVGGFAGFFQKRCIEVDARAGGPRIDVYDEAEGEAEGTPEAPLNVPPSFEADAPAPTTDFEPLEATLNAAPAQPAAQPAAPAGPTSPAATAGAAAAAQAAATMPLFPTEPNPIRNDAATREGLATPAVQELVEGAAPFADLLGQMTQGAAASPAAGMPAVGTPAAKAAPAPSPAAATPAATEVEEEPAADAEPEPKRISNVREGMIAAGLGADLAGNIVDSVVANVSPFYSPGRLKTLVRNELSLRLPITPAPGPGRRRLAVVGPAGTGKTAAVARIASAHAAVGQDVAVFTVEPVDGGAALRALLGDSGVKVEAINCDELAVSLCGENAAIVLVDTPSASSGAATSIESLAATLGSAGLDEIHLAIRAGTASPAAVETLERLRPLGPNRILVTAAADTSYIGAAVDVAIRTELPIHYVAENVVDLAPADPRALASKVMP
jgi:flagellar biosynthesis protein FlhF